MDSSAWGQSQAPQPQHSQPLPAHPMSGYGQGGSHAYGQSASATGYPPGQGGPGSGTFGRRSLPVRHRGEIPLLVMSVVVAAFAYFILFLLIIYFLNAAFSGMDVNVGSLETQVGVVMLGAPLLIFYARAAQAAKIRSNSVRMSPTQFPEAYAVLQEAAARWNMKVVPEGFVVLGQGNINAFAFGHGWRRYVAIHSDLFEVGGQARDPAALKFVIGHEIGHIAAGHTSYFRILASLVMSRIWFLGPALSRSQEYTADNYGYDSCPEGHAGAIKVLAAGKYLNKLVEFDTMADRAVWDKGFFIGLGNLMASHPILTWRAHALRDRSQHGSLFFRPKTGIQTPDHARWFPDPGAYGRAASDEPVHRVVSGRVHVNPQPGDRPIIPNLAGPSGPAQKGYGQSDSSRTGPVPTGPRRIDYPPTGPRQTDYPQQAPPPSGYAQQAPPPSGYAQQGPPPSGYGPQDERGDPDTAWRRAFDGGPPGAARHYRPTAPPSQPGSWPEQPPR